MAGIRVSNRLRYTIPNTFTATSLLIGVGSIVTGQVGFLELAGWMIIWCGLLDVMEASLSLGDAVAAWRRLGSGVHVPHPAVRQERTTATQMSFGGSARAWLDGRPIGPIDKLSLRVESGALRVAV